MGPQRTIESLLQLVGLLAQLPFGQRRQHSRIGLSCQQGVEDRAGRDPRNVSHDTGQLEIGVFQGLLQPIHRAHPIVDQ
jgi:hypothetical protein